MRLSLNYWVVIYRSAWILLVVLFAIGLTCIFLPRVHSLRSLQRKKAELIKQNRRIEALTRELRDKQERFNSDPAFVERVARETGKVKPNEVVFVFTNQYAEPAVEGPQENRP